MTQELLEAERRLIATVEKSHPEFAAENKKIDECKNHAFEVVVRWADGATAERCILCGLRAVRVPLLVKERTVVPETGG